MSGFDKRNFSSKVARFGDVKEGDFLLDENNNPVRVDGVAETHIPERMFKVEDDNGNFINVSGTHLWYVVTDNDRATHHDRKKLAKKVLSPLLTNKIVLNRLISFADNIYKTDGHLEISIVDVLALLFDDEEVDLDDEQVLEVFHVVSRIAESVGPVSETNIEYRDMAFEQEKEFHKVIFFDARLLAQQVLALAGKRSHRKKYKIRVGRVVTTQVMLEMMENGQDVYIPD